MDKKQQKEEKQFDREVMRKLVENGILNSLQATMVTEISGVVANSDYDVMKPYREIRTDIDHQMATEMVFEYLRRNNMTETIRCIELETNGKLVPPAKSSANFSKEIGVNAKQDMLHQTILTFSENLGNDLAAKNHDDLIEQIQKRYADLPQDDEQQEGRGRSSSSSKKKHHHRSKDKA